jgi:hypothetical protein
MYPYDIIFRLNDNDQFRIEQLSCYCQIPIFFVSGGQYWLSNDALPDGVRYLHKLLSRALDNKLQLHDSIKKGIGYLDNVRIDYEYHQFDEDEDKDWEPCPELAYELQDGYPCWVGFRYNFLACSDFATWIYNDKNGTIVLEITPQYPHFDAKDTSKVRISYDGWLKEYKPLFVRIISPDIARQWLQQADQVIGHIEKRWAEAESKAGDSTRLVYEECPRNKN